MDLFERVPSYRYPSEAKPKVPEQTSRREFMTLEEFDFITTEQLASITFSRASNFDLEKGFTGEMFPDKKWTIDKTGKLVETDRFSIRLASQLKGEERGITFLKLLHAIRFQEDIKKNGEKNSTVGEEHKRSMQLEKGVRDFYHTHQGFVDSYLDRMQRDTEQMH